ncbi:MAG TPA: heme exporter protein CcmD [Casimicrobiaceae bacterium]|nr:heme exporter protein CcmD [Casimicrobiaceae bacterium]
MNPWPFVICAYVVTIVVVAIEVFAVRARFRSARTNVADATRSGDSLE